MISVSSTVWLFPTKVRYYDTEKKKNLAVVAGESQEEHTRKKQLRNTAVPQLKEDYSMQKSEEKEGRVTKKLSQKFSRTKNQILGALSKLDKFLFNLQVWAQSGTVSGTSRDSNTENHEPNEDRSQNYSCPEINTIMYRSPQSLKLDLDEASYNCRV